MILILPAFHSNFPFVIIILLLRSLFITLSLYFFASQVQACLSTDKGICAVSIEKLDLLSPLSATLSKCRFGISDALEKLIVVSNFDRKAAVWLEFWCSWLLHGFIVAVHALCALEHLAGTTGRLDTVLASSIGFLLRRHPSDV